MTSNANNLSSTSLPCLPALSSIVVCNGPFYLLRPLVLLLCLLLYIIIMFLSHYNLLRISSQFANSLLTTYVLLSLTHLVAI
jgi:hypothetical protein